MPATAWRKAMQHVVNVQRNTTSASPSGATRLAYTTVATGLKCSLQSGGGRMRQTDLGQDPGRVKSAIFGQEAIAILQQNDLLVLQNVEIGRRYKIMSLHTVPDANAPHVEATVEQWVPGGGE